MSYDIKVNYLNTIRNINNNINELKVAFNKFKRVNNIFILLLKTVLEQ